MKRLAAVLVFVLAAVFAAGRVRADHRSVPQPCVSTGSLDPDNVSYQSSAISAIDTWRSRVLLVHGNDDRNVQFSQTTGLVQLLRAHNVYHELIVFPDDTHEPLRHKRYLYAFNRLDAFLGRFLKDERAHTTSGVR